uniref:Uncharacterized protein n=1 Tax=Oryza nivara TaxID=4536 RepID=A0A0E0HYD1_ORYNI
MGESLASPPPLSPPLPHLAAAGELSGQSGWRRARPNLGGAPSLRVEGGLAHEEEVDDAAWRCRIRRHRGQIRFPRGGGSGASTRGSDWCKQLKQRRWEAEAAGGSW